MFTGANHMMHFSDAWKIAVRRYVDLGRVANPRPVTTVKTGCVRIRAADYPQLMQRLTRNTLIAINFYRATLC